MLLYRTIYVWRCVCLSVCHTSVLRRNGQTWLCHFVVCSYFLLLSITTPHSNAKFRRREIENMRFWTNLIVSLERQRIDVDVNVRTLIIVVICYYCMFQEEKFLLNSNTFSDLYSCLHVWSAGASNTAGLALPSRPWKTSRFAVSSVRMINQC